MHENTAITYIVSWLEAYVYLNQYRELDRNPFPGLKDVFGERFKLWLKESCKLDDAQIKQICDIATNYRKELVYSAMDQFTIFSAALIKVAGMC